MELTTINEELLKTFKKGDITILDVQYRIRFAINCQNTINAIEHLLNEEISQLSNNEREELVSMINKIKKIKEE